MFEPGELESLAEELRPNYRLTGTSTWWFRADDTQPLWDRIPTSIVREHILTEAALFLDEGDAIPVYRRYEVYRKVANLLWASQGLVDAASLQVQPPQPPPVP